MKKNFLLLLGLLSISLLIFFNLKTHLNKKSYAYAVPSNLNTNVAVDVSIGEFRFTLFGYASPNALVTFEGMGIYDQTYSDNKGYFEFRNRFSPLVPREACLTAQDQLGRITAPTCLPPFPIKYDINIGPVLMPPTLSLNQENYYIGDEVVASGQTIPNTDVSFSTFIDERKSFLNSLVWGFVKPVEAYTFPELSTKADEKGNYSISLPSSDNSYFRIFSQTNYNDSNSPQSNRLNLKINPIWMIIVHLFIGFLSLIKSRALELIVLSECFMVCIFLLRRYLHPHAIANNKALALSPIEGLAVRQPYPIVEEETEIVLKKSYLPAKL